MFFARIEKMLAAYCSGERTSCTVFNQLLARMANCANAFIAHLQVKAALQRAVRASATPKALRARVQLQLSVLREQSAD